MGQAEIKAKVDALLEHGALPAILDEEVRYYDVLDWRAKRLLKQHLNNCQEYQLADAELFALYGVRP
jgi:hypothetical protein